MPEESDSRPAQSRLSAGSPPRIDVGRQLTTRIVILVGLAAESSHEPAMTAWLSELEVPGSVRSCVIICEGKWFARGGRNAVG